MTSDGPTDMTLKSVVLLGVTFTILLTPPISLAHFIMPESVPWLSLLREEFYIFGSKAQCLFCFETTDGRMAEQRTIESSVLNKTFEHKIN